MRKKIAVLGATGSVGSQTLDVARRLRDELEVVCITAHTDMEVLFKAAEEFKPKTLAVTSTADASILKNIGYGPEILSGKGALTRAALGSGADLVVLAVDGIAGLETFAACLKNKIPVALANKESLVCGGDVVLGIMKETGTQVLPVDSEHSAIFQILNHTYDSAGIKKLMITASGGPFRGKKRSDLENASPQMALRHPNWSMGKKITIDSATLANKGLEVIEAHYLFGLDLNKIQVIVHPQSIVHSMVEFWDHSILAQLGPVDMRLPIQKALLFPKMEPFVMGSELNLAKLAQLTFEAPDMETFNCLALAYQALEARGPMTTIFNVANEVAVALFLKEKIKFLAIADLIEESMGKYSGESCKSIEEILHINDTVRKYLRGRYDV